MRWALLGLGALALLAVAFVAMQGVGRGSAPHSVAPPTGMSSVGSAFVVHDAPPATPGSPSPDTPAPDLDAVMQRLRNAAATPASGLPPVAPKPDVVVVTPPAPAAPPATSPPPDAGTRWTNVSSQGARWRLTRGTTMALTIDLGSGQTATVQVEPAFANLDPAAVNLRVDYLKQTILQSFSSRSATYSFGRDGSISLLPP